MRAPTPIELTCADPEAPCRLPNEFLSDPPLAKVVSKTIELGARGRIGQATTWSAAVYRTDLDDDIEFTSSGGAVNAGFFRNVGKTRRQGIELAATTRYGPVSFDLRYNHIEATFRSPFAALAPNNSSADENGTIDVMPGNRIPGIPADSFKMRAEYEHGPLQIGAGLIAASSQYAHGDENNSDVNGKVPGYAVVNLDARYEVTRQMAIFAQVSNLFDKQYYNFAVLGENFFTGPGRSFGPASGTEPVPEQFRAIGAPRGFWIGFRYSFETPKPRS
jgi:outer membrane receptor protein involved in Fe transport